MQKFLKDKIDLTLRQAFKNLRREFFSVVDLTVSEFEEFKKIPALPLETRDAMGFDVYDIENISNEKTKQYVKNIVFGKEEKNIVLCFPDSGIRGLFIINGIT